jgi:zona occludens toxin
MITLFTGMPGAGKTVSLVDLLSKLDGTRPIYVDGLEGLTLPHTVVDATNWHNDLPDGAILVIDEVQRVWRPRGAGAKVPDAVSALETHRHRGIDIFLTTQAPRLLDSNVRGLVGRHVHIRDTGVLGRYWYEWPETNDQMLWKSCVTKHRISLPKKSFDLYKSASIHTKPIRAIPNALYFGALSFVAFLVLAFFVYKIMTRPPPAPVLPSPTAANAALSALTLPASMNHAVAPKPKHIDDRIDFIPRVSYKPESAPAYDHLREISVMPVVRTGYCMGEVCRCFTNQGTDPGISAGDCRRFVEHPPFDHYLVKSKPNQEPFKSGVDLPSPDKHGT